MLNAVYNISKAGFHSMLGVVMFTCATPVSMSSFETGNFRFLPTFHFCIKRLVNLRRFSSSISLLGPESKILLNEYDNKTLI